MRYNGYGECFNGKLRDELLNEELFYTLHEAQVLFERWRCHYNTPARFVRWDIGHRHQKRARSHRSVCRLTELA